MGLGELLELLLKKENWRACLWIGGLMLALGAAFFLGGGFPQAADEDAVILSEPWFRGIFVILMSGNSLGGLLLVSVGLAHRTSRDEESHAN